ncbi:MAG TPA: CHASE domain-containing protein [Mariprofundaceae bacterium]|nr:CHASE domain-containing protein [Mariprofundaceae bacterium]
MANNVTDYAGLHRPLIATLIMTMMVSGVIAYAIQFLRHQQMQHLQDQFQADIAEVQTKIEERMTAYGQVLKGGRSLFLASDQVSRNEWHEYVSNLELDHDYPGIQGVGYAISIPAAKRVETEQKLRSDGFPDFRVWPEGQRDPYSAIIYLEPFDWRNQRAFGYDMYSEPTRHEAMQRARDTGTAALSGKVLLVQETDKAPQAGTLLYVPLYRKGEPLNSVVQRQQALLGWIYSPYRMDNLIEGMLGKLSTDIRLRIYDVDDGNPDALLFDSFLNRAGPDATYTPLIRKSLTMETAGRQWVLDFEAMPAYARTIGLGMLYKESSGMVLIGLLLIALTWSLFDTRRKAGLMAMTLTSSLRDSEERWKFALEGSGDGVWDWNIETGEVLFTPRFLQMLDMDEEGMGHAMSSWLERVHPDDIEMVKSHLDRHLSGETSEYVCEHRMRRRDDSYIWVLGRGRVISRDEDGRPLRLVGTKSDITNRREAEERIRLLSQSVHQAGEAIMMTDARGLIEYVNPAFCRITGYSEDEVLGKTPGLLKSGVQGELLYESMWGSISGGKTWQGRVVDRKKDGSFYPAMLTISPITNDAGEITNYVGIQQDLQEYENMEARFRQSQKMEAIGTLVGGIAHDFNNTLAGITGNLYLARKEAASIPELVDRLSAIEQLSFRTAGMIQQLLTFSRKSKPSMAPVSIASFLKESIKLQQASLPENIGLQLDIHDPDLLVQGDINLLQQALINLYNNARDALEGVENPVIRVELARFSADKSFRTANPVVHANEFAHITVSDNGHGISEKDIDHIFEPFFTTKEAGKGTGLGLAMVYGAVESHGGVITVESGGQGAAFHIYLPLIESLATQVPDPSQMQVVSGNGETILLVDDHEETLKTNRDVLDSLNYRVMTARDGREAIEMYRQHQDEIDLVILDVVMPKVGGKEAFEAMRQINPEVRAMFATGYDRANVLKDADLADMQVINKPFSIGELSQVVRRVLAG